ncbi:MAG: radical SAM protein, partial [Eggerthellaceae bacterium]|nr:radical SAM protein [Eggerthellaceae bacterium]
MAHIIAALRENPTLDMSGVERIMREQNGRAATRANPRPLTKRLLMPFLLRMRAEDTELWRRWALTEEEFTRLVSLLRVKPRRTQSGVATITVITRPETCRGACIFCPTEPGMPKSYLADEPACQRALQSSFDPYLQVSRRLRALSEMGHPTGKAEIIILGGTWDDYPENYRVWFVTRIFRALNGFRGLAAREAGEPKTAGPAGEPAPGPATEEAFAELFTCQRENEDAPVRCVGLVVETRPDCITPESLTFARACGATKIQMGVQSLDEEILAANGRPMTLDTIRRAFALLRLLGF